MLTHGPLKSLNLSNTAKGLINSGQNTKGSFKMTFGIIYPRASNSRSTIKRACEGGMARGSKT